MKVIGYSSFNHDASISLVEDGKILACYAEERFSRDKYNVFSTPKLGLEQLCKDYNFQLSDNDVVVAAAVPVWTNDQFLEYILQHKKEVAVYDHHYCHAIGAYLTSGFKEKTLIVTFDSTSSTNWFKDKITKKDLFAEQGYKSNYFNVYLGEGNNIELVKKVDGAPYNYYKQYWNTLNNITGFWHIITVDGFGFKTKDEGKVMGLAPQGKFDLDLYNRLKKYFNFEHTNSSVFAHELHHYLKPEGWFEDEQKKRDFAYTLQRLSEDFIVDCVAELQKQYPEYKKLVLAGGFFANVKANQRLNEYLSFEELYIMPPMGDDGLSIGAALAKAKEIMPIENKRWDNAFLGKGYTNDEIWEELKNKPNLVIKPLDHKYLAQKLSEGLLVGVFRGRAEYGPRALGNRTILCDPRKQENHAYINRKLGRNEIMPFAPIVMSEYISDICYAYKSLRAAEFMTLCYTVKEKWIDKIPAVVQKDDASCRSQVIVKERNPFSWEVLNEFHSITGVPVLLNTSFNIHGEPIVNHPSHVIKHLENNVIDILVLNNMVVELK